ncbi:hypothetical protein BKA70DRAFT_885037 [Coprinopsis sp. MPI-PUGE-AT-0042]|nr:hypothetical protein BKA70DRAFT_885037 [Coprinopsis sp. MPI-PUGE-AT-0042]
MGQIRGIIAREDRRQGWSLTIHLQPECWVSNDGTKFLYPNQMASLLGATRAHGIPADFLDLFHSMTGAFEPLVHLATRNRDSQRLDAGHTASQPRDIACGRLRVECKVEIQLDRS